MILLNDETVVQSARLLVHAYGGSRLDVRWLNLCATSLWYRVADGRKIIARIYCLARLLQLTGKGGQIQPEIGKTKLHGMDNLL